MTDFKDIRDFAYFYHVTLGQQRYGEGTYVDHLDEVWGILQEYGPSCFGEGPLLAYLRQVAYTHDFLEDVTVLRPGEQAEVVLRQRLGSDSLFKAVKFCTDEPGGSRKERKAKTYARCRADIDRDYLAFHNNVSLRSFLLKAGWTFADVPVPGYPHPYVYFGVAVKLADRLANLRRATASKSSMLTMYRKEAQAFREALYLPDLLEPMWAEYDRLTDEKHARQAP